MLKDEIKTIKNNLTELRLELIQIKKQTIRQNFNKIDETNNAMDVTEAQAKRPLPSSDEEENSQNENPSSAKRGKSVRSLSPVQNTLSAPGQELVRPSADLSKRSPVVSEGTRSSLRGAGSPSPPRVRSRSREGAASRSNSRS